MPTAPKTNTGFVSLQDYLNANQPAVGQTANGLVSDAQAASQPAITQAQNEANNIGQELAQKEQAQNKKLAPTSLADYSKAQTDAQGAVQQEQNRLSGLSDVNQAGAQLATKYGYGLGSGSDRLDANLQVAGGQAPVQAAQKGLPSLTDYLNQQVAGAQNGFTPTKEAGSTGDAPVNTPTQAGANDNGVTGVYRDYQKPPPGTRPNARGGGF